MQTAGQHAIVNTARTKNNGTNGQNKKKRKKETTLDSESARQTAGQHAIVNPARSKNRGTNGQNKKKNKSSTSEDEPSNKKCKVNPGTCKRSLTVELSRVQCDSPFLKYAVGKCINMYNQKPNWRKSVEFLLGELKSAESMPTLAHKSIKERVYVYGTTSAVPNFSTPRCSYIPTVFTSCVAYYVAKTVKFNLNFTETVS